MTRFSARKRAACARRNLSPAEYALLCSAGLRINLPPGGFVRHSRALAEGGREALPSLAEFENAFASLCERGLLTVLSPEDIEQEFQRMQNSPYPEICNAFYQPGDVDFTLDGNRLYRELALEIFGPEHLAFDDSGFAFDETSQVFVVLAPSRELCLRRIEEIKADPQSYAPSDRARAIMEITEPEKIGSWMPDRFVLLDNGYRAFVRLDAGRPV